MVMIMIKREEYINQLIRFKDKELIKVITGIRRCGKSTLFDLYCDYLLENGVKKEQIIRINLEDMAYRELDTYTKLYDYINEKLLSNTMNYIFLDEIQNIEKFQKACDSLFIKKNVDLYITGSNAFLLSGELATLLSGRYVEIKMLPLSFKEYVSNFTEKNNVDRLFKNYISYGSFPYTLKFEDADDIEKYVLAIYDSIVLKDIMARKKFPDYTMLQGVINFMLDNVGNLCSTNKIANTMTSAGRSISVHTVENYITSRTESVIFYKASRYDINWG